MRRLTAFLTVAAALAFAGVSQAATPTFVQGTTASSSGTTLSQAYTSNVTGGSLLVGIFRAQAGTTVSDSLNGAWTEAPGPLAPNSIWYKANAAAGADTVTVKSTTSGSLRMVFAEYSNVLASAPLVSSGCATGTGATVTTPSIASAAGDLMFGGVGIGNTPITVSSSNLRNQFTNTTGTSADADLTSTGSPQSVAFGLSSSPALGWSSCAADFKPAADVTPPGGGGDGTTVFDGTFSPTDPVSGPHWNQTYGNCYSYTAANELTLHITSSCNPANNGHYRTDVCTGGPNSCSATSGLEVYHKGTAYCTSVPEDLTTPIANQSGNSWVQIAEMKDSTSGGGDWSFGLADGGVAKFGVGFDGGVYHNTDAWTGSATTTGWHTFSVCQSADGTSATIFFDGVQQTFNIGSCAGKTVCTGLNLYYDGFSTQPLDINAYTGNTSGADPYVPITVIHGDPLVQTGATNGLPPEPVGGWNSP